MSSIPIGNRPLKIPYVSTTTVVENPRPRFASLEHTHTLADIVPGISHSELLDLTANDHPQYVYKLGDTMEGFLSLYKDPVAPKHAVTKAYSDAHAGHEIQSNSVTLPKKEFLNFLGSEFTVVNDSTSTTISFNFTSIDHNTLDNLTVGNPHTQYVLKAGDTLSGALINYSNTPTLNLELVPKIYVDTLVSTSIAAAVITDHNLLDNLTVGNPHTQYVLKAGDTLTGQLLLYSTTHTNILEAVSKGYVDSNFTKDHSSLINLNTGNPHPQYPLKTGDIFSGVLKLNISPIDPDDAVRKDYVDSVIINDHGDLLGLEDIEDHPGYIVVTGARPFDGDQSMGNNKLTDLLDPVDNLDAVNLQTLNSSITTAITNNNTNSSFQTKVISLTDDTPTLTLGNRYIVPDPTLYVSWLGQENKIAEYNGIGWDFTIPNKGTVLFVEDQNKIFYFTDDFPLGVWENLNNLFDHSLLQNLGVDSHTQYVHNTSNRVITAQHTFNFSGSPFLLGVGSTGVLVSGLNSDLLDGEHGSYYLDWNNFPGTIPLIKLPTTGIDADTLDGLDSTAFSLISHNHNHNSLTNLTVGDPHTQYLLVNGTKAFTGNQSLGGFKITNSADPTSNLDLANKQYVDSQVSNIENILNLISWQGPIVNNTLTSPPVGPALNSQYIVASVGSGAWLGQTNNIAFWNGSSWIFYVPVEGTTTYLQNVNKYSFFNGSSWVYLDTIIDHSLLQNLNVDSHTQYTHNSINRTITATHTFNPFSVGAPFILGANSLNQFVSGLNSDLLDGEHGSYYLDWNNFPGNVPLYKIPSGIDADTLDGLDSTAFSLTSHNHSHNSLTGLTTGDPHTQYVNKFVASSILARHTFDTAGSPFILGSGAINQLVSGLNSEYLDGELGIYYLDRDNHFGTTPLSSIPQGSGSTLDADKLDGLDSTAFSLVSHTHDHNSLSNLSIGNVHSQYVHRTINNGAITAKYTFNTSGSPFLLSGSSVGFLVSGLNADLLDGYHASDFILANTLPSIEIDIYAPANTDPVPLTLTEGDLYFNKQLLEYMYYDGTRSKWLSINTISIQAGRKGDTLPGSYYRGVDGMTLDGADRVFSVPKGTITAVSWSQTSSSSATLEILNNGATLGVPAEVVLSSSGTVRVDTKNVNIQAGTLSFRNKLGGNTTTNVQIIIEIKKRI